VQAWIAAARREPDVLPQNEPGELIA
jgi:hypothetical protein